MSDGDEAIDDEKDDWFHGLFIRFHRTAELQNQNQIFLGKEYPEVEDVPEDNDHMHQVEIVFYQILFSFQDGVELVQSILHNVVIAIVDNVLVHTWLSDSINISKCFCCTFHH